MIQLLSSINLKKNPASGLYLCVNGGAVATISFDDAMLILKRWQSGATLLFVAASGQPAEFQSRALVAELTNGGVLLKNPAGGAQFRVGFSTSEGMSCWYFEPREFSERDECKEWLSTLSEGEKFASSLGFKFSGRVSGAMIEDLSIPLGEVVFIEIID